MCHLGPPHNCLPTFWTLRPETATLYQWDHSTGQTGMSVVFLPGQVHKGELVRSLGTKWYINSHVRGHVVGELKGGWMLSVWGEESFTCDLVKRQRERWASISSIYHLQPRGRAVHSGHKITVNMKASFLYQVREKACKLQAVLWFLMDDNTPRTFADCLRNRCREIHGINL